MGFIRFPCVVGPTARDTEKSDPLCSALSMEPYMNVLRPEKKQAVLSALIEGCSIRSTSRTTGVHKTTILKTLVEVGTHCALMLDEQIHSLTCTAIECDEIWTFIAKKERRLTDDDRLQHP